MGILTSTLWGPGGIGLLVLTGALALASILYFLGRWAWERQSAELRAGLEECGSPRWGGTVHPGRMADLPDPVGRYLRAALPPGGSPVASVRIRHSGEFNLGHEHEARWVSFRSDQWTVTSRPGFVWDAVMRLAPGLNVHVHDAYVCGRGVLRARLLGLIPVMEQDPAPELAHGELMRFFAESAWYPTALLPDRGVTWEGVDDRTARGTLRDGDTSVTLTFGFDGEGLLDTVRSEGRYRHVDGQWIATPWQGRFWDYRDRSGMKIPLEGEVSWMLAEGAAPYWRGTIEEIDHRFA